MLRLGELFSSCVCGIDKVDDDDDDECIGMVWIGSSTVYIGYIPIFFLFLQMTCV
jgi:hypothetical protein